MSGGKVPERRSDLRLSEKELPERRSCAFRHKNTPDYTCREEPEISPSATPVPVRPFFN
jgi:hypothetical protein